MVMGRPTLGASIDEKAGYSNHHVSDESSRLLGFVLFGYVFEYLTLPFGWKLGAFIHQRFGLLLTGYFRFHGARISQYIDDRNLVARRGFELCTVTFQRDMYIVLMLLLLFGYWTSKSKSNLIGNVRWVTLGFVCDTVAQAFLVGSDEFGWRKRDIAVALGEQLAADARDNAGRISWPAAARFAGKSISFAAACPFVRFLLNCSYSVLHGRHVWWGKNLKQNRVILPISHLDGDDVVITSAEGRASYIREVLSIVTLLREARVWPFLEQRHTCICQLQTDATLTQGGGVLLLTEEAKAAGIASPWGANTSVAFGQLLPEMLFGCHLGGINSGIGEWAGLWITFAAIDNDPHLRSLVVNKIVSVKMDNQEVVSSMNSGAVGGAGTLIKNEILLAVLHFMLEWNCQFVFTHVPGIDNLADAPSRAEEFGGIMLNPATFEWLYRDNPVGPFDFDCMSSFACAQRPPGWEARGKPDCFLPYYSIGPDPYAAGVDCFAQDVRGPGVVTWFNYVNPPHCMLESTVLFFAESRAHALFILPDCRHEWWWPEYVVPYCTWQSTLGKYEARYRCKLAGWRATKQPVLLTAYILDFRDMPA
jgi:hypothetical protein